MGLALGSAAFSLPSTAELVPGASLQDASVKPIAEFEAEPARTLTEGWGDLVDIATVDSAVGQRLVQTAIDQTQWDDPQLEAHLYTEDGSAVTSQDDVEQLQTEIASRGEQFWIVPGVIKRYAAPEPVAVPDAPTHHLHCSDCHEETVHRYTGKTTQRERDGWPVWICTDCHNPQFGHDPLDPQSSSVFADLDSLQETQTQHHQAVLATYKDEFGHYPWQNRNVS
ncbi:hypothetical protein [Halorientalis salina]|uniref:hypothetical protein n=1 Tax=Halorientalis salina TaxID=2932266 RepID=UPI0010AD7F08|nr:hypothetical protein [Halorientalis salina]